MLGEKILNYLIEKKIGEGGIGTVYLATHTQLGRKVAIKVLNPELVNRTEIKERFRQEASTLSALQHLNIVTLYDYWEDAKGLFLIMEYVEGLPLDEYLQKYGKISENKALEIFCQILDGVQYAHQKAIVHRDIKPSNIIFEENQNKAKILDFGIAKILKTNTPTQTQAGVKIGTVLYMSPEQVKGENIDIKTDIYSLGVLLYEMLTGKNPYNTQSQSEFTIYNQIINELLPQDTSISAKVRQIIDKATAKNPQNRYQNCEEMKKDILAIIQPQNNNSGNNSGNNANTIRKKNPAKTIEKARQRRDSSFALISVALLALVGIVGYFIYLEVNKTSENLTKNVADVKEFEEDKKPSKEEKKEVKEEKKTKEDLQIDSLKNEIKKIEDFIKSDDQFRKDQMLKKLVITDQIIENDEIGGEFTFEITVTNKLDDVKFKDIFIDVTYYDKAGKEIKTLPKEVESINEGQSIPFKVKENINPAKYTCRLKSATPYNYPNPPTLDSLNKEKENLSEKMEELKKRKQEKAPQPPKGE